MFLVLIAYKRGSDARDLAAGATEPEFRLVANASEAQAVYDQWRRTLAREDSRGVRAWALDLTKMPRNSFVSLLDQEPIWHER